MNELFTFNSRQLQNITNQSQLPSHSPKYRKRILSAKLSKKLTNQSRLRSDCLQNLTDRAPVVTKKVRFNIPDLSACLVRDVKVKEDIVREPRSTVLQRKKSDNHERRELDSKDDYKNDFGLNLVRKLVKRAFSAVERDPQTPKKDSVTCVKEQAQEEERREKRVNSVKGSPKVLIPFNSKRLPDVFKMKLGQRRTLKEKGLEKKLVEQSPRSKLCKEDWIDNFGPAVSGVSRNLCCLQERLYERLYGGKK